MSDLVTGADAPEETPAVLDASILGQLRASRAKIGAGAEPLKLAIPGYDPEVVVKYKWVPLKTLTRTAQSLSKMTEMSEQAIAAAADTVVSTCHEVCVRINGELVPLSTSDVPVTFGDPRLAYALGFGNPGNARQMAVLAFNNEHALINLAAEIVEWLKDTTRRVDEEALGE